jgi:hypothetical protein
VSDASTNAYHFVSRWRVKATCGEVADILGDPLALPRWWPSVYLAVEEIRPPDAHGRGRRAALLTKGWLPYTLRWSFEVVDWQYPGGFTIQAEGDFDGRGVWTFTQDGEWVDIVYDWRIRAEKPLLRRLSFLLKPIFEANHRWAMARGEESLRLELLRRRATNPSAAAAVPPPPQPVTYAGVALVAGAAVVGGVMAYLIIRAGRARAAERERRR